MRRIEVTVTRTGLAGAGDWLAGYLSALWVLVRVWRQRRRMGHG
jgi:hypothetical protein